MSDSWKQMRGGLIRPCGDAERVRAQRLSARGQLERVIAGIYGPPGAAADVAHRIEALGWLDPDAIITGCAAARWWWPEIQVGEVAAVRSARTVPERGFTWQRRRLPVELVLQRGGVRFTRPELTVLDLIPSLGGAIIDEALRCRAVTLLGLHRVLALTPGRRDNGLRALLLHDSRDEPWSEAERDFHRILRGAPLGFGFRSNYRVELPDGGYALLDAAIPELLLGFEVDGFAFHTDRPAFERDRARDTGLAGIGWQIVRFSASFIGLHPAETERRVLAVVRERVLLLGLDSQLSHKA